MPGIALGRTTKTLPSGSETNLRSSPTSSGVNFAIAILLTCGPEAAARVAARSWLRLNRERRRHQLRHSPYWQYDKERDNSCVLMKVYQPVQNSLFLSKYFSVFQAPYPPIYRK